MPPSRRVWIFDLDNTLHDARVHIFPSMHTQIQDYLKRQFGLDDEGAGRMRRDFWLRYGTTLAGLMRHHGTDPRHFLAETHVFPELADMVVRENALKHALARLGGTRLVFSNAPRHYVEEVLRAEKLVVLTNTPGVLDKAGKLLTGLTPKKIDDLVAKGVISGGMLPKIGSALDAARSGVKSVHIIDGRVPHALLLEVLTDQGVGTLIRSK